MTIGELNRRVDVLELFEERDDFGGVTSNWLTIAQVWAKIEPISGTEFFKAEQISAETTTKITIRYYKTLNVMHRIRYKDKIYEIKCISDLETAHRWTVINCKELVDYGLQCKTEES
ncbi:MAG TPA: phage head closure protein [Clostridia bacterium]